MYIYDNVVILSSMWSVLRFEHAHGLKRYNEGRLVVKQPVVSEVLLVLDSFYPISFLQFLSPFYRNDFSFDGLLTLLRESGRHSKSSQR